ncbi:carbamoyl phosphate synthase small subunit [Marinococcus halophilus]|uniref:Carbamoyl phosphate synthase small chain n=1 Tax=Marinococcus halophilus TaxID=1371 RepID=A0A510Y2B2_MARHA|nr:carbamoyl phosphate synthase small subunit [Marinococcus halophilus]OZT81380.1 carbamoyl phosphate synthase small subunit [Marinococcus halophilus]GEK57333.1 carbamoyl-phosphate synthase small chain [Marinococcus halophilus]
MKRKLILENGAVFHGEGIGSERETVGEVVFNTGMTGYQEILSDPSYCDQLVTLTYPLIGNYGINRDDFETMHPSAGGLIIKEAASHPSNFRSIGTLSEWLKEKDIPGLCGIDTRRLTKMIRTAGTLRGRLCTEEVDEEEAVRELQQWIDSRDQVSRVSTKNAYHAPGNGKRVVLMDYGAKHGITRNLLSRGCDVFVLPYNATAKEVLALNPDGVMLSNGPGDPEDVPEAVKTLRSLVGEVPVFGICLGHQLLSLACGATSSKLKFGHRGGNHPVKQVKTGRVDITSQNHGYTVDRDSLMGTDLVLTHVNVNDGTVEGVEHREYPAFSVQYHPEACPGPSDANDLFDQFVRLMNRYEKVPTRI